MLNVVKNPINRYTSNNNINNNQNTDGKMDEYGWISPNNRRLQSIING